MWITLAVISALGLGIYDIFKKTSLRGNNVLTVLLLNTVFGAALMSPVVVGNIIDGSWGFGGNAASHLLILLKSGIVLASWTMGYFAMKHMPLTITGSINATRPVLVLVGALLIFGERLNALQWVGIVLGFVSLFLISRIGRKEGFSLTGSKWIWLALGATVMGAVSGLYDKYLLRSLPALEVQAWYSLYQVAIMAATIALLRRSGHADSTPFRWRWTIPCIALFLTAADLAYFYCLSLSGAMISVVSMIRRGSVLVSFLYGAVVLREKHIGLKLIDLAILLLALVLLVVASH
ncbi:MAG: DMT family transporter [Bacteroidales bacterium]|nr:DMT family transporter [Bacteroidales bacterium]